MADVVCPKGAECGGMNRTSELKEAKTDNGRNKRKTRWWFSKSSNGLDRSDVEIAMML
jgi:hypothetical protein